MQVQDYYQEAIRFAAAKHGEANQKVPGTDLPYLVHVCNVAMEVAVAQRNDFNLGFALQVALLHDTLEDTTATFEELVECFGVEVAEAVKALTKNDTLPQQAKMMDSLNRIKHQSVEVASVKLADRITNMQQPPFHWSKEKKIEYQKEAQLILDVLGYANTYLAQRLKEKIKEYGVYI